MWYFLIKQSLVDRAQYESLQKRASLTEVELFNEPHENWYVFAVEKEAYSDFVDHLDRVGIGYNLLADRPSRGDMLAGF